MTEKELKEKIKLLEKNIQCSRDAKNLYEQELIAMEKEKKKLSMQHYVGKCYQLCTTVDENFSDYDSRIKSFKVIRIIDEQQALCLVLTEDMRCGMWLKEISFLNINLWKNRILQLKNCENALKFIDCCVEISEDAFQKMYQEYTENIWKKSVSALNNGGVYGEH